MSICRYGGDVGGWGHGQILFHTRTQRICGNTAYGLAGERFMTYGE